MSNLEFDTLNPYFVDTVGGGQILNNAYNWYGTSKKLTMRNEGFTGSGYANGVFSSTGNNFLGFRKILNNDTLYGWFLVQTNCNLRIKSYAYKSLYASVNEIKSKDENIFVYQTQPAVNYFCKAQMARN